MMIAEAHPDIEIYLKNCSVDLLEEWLSQRGTLTKVRTERGSHRYRWQYQEQEIPVMIQEAVVGKAWISLWFNSSETGWSQDLECARELSRDLAVQTRCIVSGWQEGDEPDEWWKIESGQEDKILWTTR